MTAGNWKPLIWSLIIVAIVGTIMVLISNSFAGTQADVVNAQYNALPQFVENGFNITIPVPILPDIHMNFNLFDYPVGGVKEYFVSLATGMSLIPNIIFYPLVTIMLTGVVYSLLKMFLP